MRRFGRLHRDNLTLLDTNTQEKLRSDAICSLAARGRHILHAAPLIWKRANRMKVYLGNPNRIFCSHYTPAEERTERLLETHLRTDSRAKPAACVRAAGALVCARVRACVFGSIDRAAPHRRSLPARSRAGSAPCGA